MYLAFYGLRERPFNVTSDPSFFFLSRKHKEALSHLFYGTSQRKGIISITGEIGTGKTTLCRYFLSRLDKRVKTALILNSRFSGIQLLEAITGDFGIKVRDRSRFGFVSALNQYLLRESGKGNNVVLIIDEAQNLQAVELEQIRLLSNLETEKDKLIQIVLTGQPELNRKLEQQELRQLQQRIAVRFHITPLESDEVGEYIAYRLEVAGAGERIHFTPEAVSAVFEFSGGTPRLVNMVCDRALLAGFVAETNTIGVDIIEKCAAELGAYSRENV